MKKAVSSGEDAMLEYGETENRELRTETGRRG
jgi:hypothetical protein